MIACFDIGYNYNRGRNMSDFRVWAENHMVQNKRYIEELDNPEEKMISFEESECLGAAYVADFEAMEYIFNHQQKIINELEQNIKDITLENIHRDHL